MSAQAVIAEARTWIGTPFRHQAKCKGVGVDCVQLIAGVGEAAGVMTIDPGKAAAFAGYGRVPNPARMGEALRIFMTPIEAGDARPGDVAWLQWRENLPMHLAILSEHKGRVTIIHALAEIGRCVEHGFTQEWRDRVVSYWRYPGLAEAQAAGG